jgi:archaellum biogenesis ATPase FlaH
MDSSIKTIKSEKSLRDYIKNLKPNSVILFIIDAKNYHQIHPRLLRDTIVEKKFAGIYITVNKPYDILVEYLKKNKIDTENIFFIDAISESVSDDIKMTNDCLFIPSPERLTDLAIALTQTLESMKNKENKFIFIDSLSTLLIYNSFDVVAKFVHFIVSRLRLFGLVGILISIEKQIDEKMTSILIEMCDEIVEVKK